MSYSNQSNVFTDDCCHREYYDERGGETVCVLCGLVLEKVLMSATVFNYEDDESDKCKKELQSFVYDVFDRGNIPLSIFDLVIDRSCKTIKAQQIKGEKRLHVAAFIIYSTLLEKNIPRSIFVIKDLTGIPTDKIWAISKNQYVNVAEVSVSDNVDAVCTNLGINFQHIANIKKIINVMSGGSGVQTGTIIASVIYLFTREVGVKVSLCNICKYCEVTPSSVHKFIAKIETKYVKNISLLI